MAKRKNGYVSTFTIYAPENSAPYYTSEYRKLNIKIQQMSRCDTAEQLKNAITDMPSRLPDVVKKAQALVSATGGTEYLQDDSWRDNRIDFVWQDDRESRDKWYGIRADLNRPSDAAISLMNQVHKAVGSMGFGTSPRFFVEKLLAAGFVPVKWVREIDAYIEDKEFHIDTAIPTPKAEEPAPAQETAEEPEAVAV